VSLGRWIKMKTITIKCEECKKTVTKSLEKDGSYIGKTCCGYKYMKPTEEHKGGDEE